MEELFVQTMRDTPVGELIVICDESGLKEIRFEMHRGEDKPNGYTEQTIDQLKDFFSGRRKDFDLDLNPEGTGFQQRVWNELNAIEYGKTITYEVLADRLGDPKVIRAAASANGKNPIPIVIPCHRVIGKDGSLTGYSGGLWRKQKLLEIENSARQGTLF